MWHFVKSAKVIVGVLSVLTLAACGGKSEPNLYKDLAAEMSSWHMTKKATEAYPNLSKPEAMKSYARKMMFDYFRKTKDPEKRQLMAAMVYLGYDQINTRARPEYCAKVNVDINSFAGKFKARHIKERKAVDIILAKNNLTRDKIWEDYKRTAMVNVKNDLLKASRMGGSHAICSDIRKHPQKYASHFNFSKTMPNVAAQLRQATVVPVKHAQKTPVPQLRR